MNKVEVLCKDKFLCGEGPLWLPQERALFWTDSDGMEIRCYHEKEQKHKKFSTAIRASSLALHADGGLVISNEKGFFSIDKQLNIKDIATECDGQGITNINDIVADPMGRIFGGQECYDPNGPYDTGYLYKIDLDGSASVVEDGLHISNGMGFSPDESTFYLVDTIVRTIYKYDYNRIDGGIHNRTIFAKLNKNDGLPDGLTVDSEGFVWIARFLGNGLTRYDPDGKIERKITLNCAQPTSLTFGGINFDEIYITSAANYWETTLAPDDHNFKTHRGGELLRIKQEIIGKPEYLVSVKK